MYIHTYMHTYIHTYITLHYITLHTYTHTYIHTYIHTLHYIHTYIHISHIFLISTFGLLRLLQVGVQLAGDGGQARHIADVVRDDLKMYYH